MWVSTEMSFRGLLIMPLIVMSGANCALSDVKIVWK